MTTNAFNPNPRTLEEARQALQRIYQQLDAGGGMVVLKSLFDANTILKANSDNIPLALTVGEQTLVGRITAGVITALTPAEVRTLLALVIGTNVQAYDADLTTWAGLTPSAFFQTLVDDASAAAFMTTLGLTANGQSLVTAADYAAMRVLLGLVIGTNVQAYDADLTTWAGLSPSANAQSLVTAANYAAMRGLLDLEAGTDFYSISAADAAFLSPAEGDAAYQPLDGQLTSIAALADSAGVLTNNGSGTMSWASAGGGDFNSFLLMGA